jgi:hypothetical protein
VLVEADPILGDLTMMPGLLATTDTMVTHPTTGMRVQILPPGEDPFELVDARVLTEVLAALQTGRTRGGPVDLIVLDAPGALVRRTGIAGLADRVLITCSARLANVKNALCNPEPALTQAKVNGNWYPGAQRAAAVAKALHSQCFPDPEDP